MSSSGGSDEERERIVGEKENADLANATNETSSIIIELSLETPIHIRWVSPSWQDIAGTEPTSLLGQPVQALIADDDKDLFDRATTKVLADDSRSIRVRFWLAIPPTQGLGMEQSMDSLDIPGSDYREAIEIDANGILIHDRITGMSTHTMWVFTVVQSTKDWAEGGLDPQLAELLLSGSDFLSTHLQQLALDPLQPVPKPLTCNICDRHIQPWFFEKHTALCIVSHRAESEVQDCQDHLLEYRHVVTDTLSQVRRVALTTDIKALGIDATRSAHISSPLSSSSPATRIIKPTEDAEKQASIHYVELVLEYLDAAIDISTPAIPDEDGDDLFGRIQSPDSKNRISQLSDWPKPITDDADLATLFQKTHGLVEAKLSAVTRLHNTIHYSEKIRQEIDARVQDLIDLTTESACQAHQEDLQAAFMEESDETATDTEASSQKRTPFLQTHEIPSPTPTAHERSINSWTESLPSSLSREVTLESEVHSHDVPSPHSSQPPTKIEIQISRPPSTQPMGKPASTVGSTIAIEHAVSARSSASRRNSPQDLESQLRDVRISRGIYDSPRRPSGGSRPPNGYSPSRRGSRAVSRSRATSLARERTVSPARRAINARLQQIDRERLSPSASPTLSASDSVSTDASFRERRVSAAPPLSPRLPSIAPAARPAPPSIKDFDIIKPISKGAFGSVYLSKKRTTGDYYAIKVLKKADMIAKNQVTNIKAERAIMMAQTESEFIAKLYFTFQSKEYLYLVMEYLNGGDCAALLKQLGGLSEDWTRRYMAEVVLGLEYLHSRGIIHRDLKPDNLLISHNGHLKLTDFGLSRVGLVGRQNRARRSSATEAPDLLRKKASSPSSSRSASFDHQSALSTPSIALLSLGDSRSGYFNIKDRKSSYASDTAETSRSEADTFTSAMSKLNLDDNRYDSDDTASTASGHSAPISRKTSDFHAHGTMSPGAAQMPPPAMKLFDPKDGNKRFVGTPDYLAPETINGSGQDDMVDWWSLGVIMFEFLYGYPPFHAASPEAVFQNILNRRIDWPSHMDELELGISTEAKDLMEHLMVLKPEERLGSQDGALDIKNHAFFQHVVWDKISEEEALFVPTPDNPEDTDYFDARGAAAHVFEDDSDTQQTSEPSPTTRHDGTKDKATTNEEFSNRLSSHNKQLLKRTVMPLSIPPHVRDRKQRNRRSSESGKDEFGSFTFKNLSVLEKQNLEALRKLKSEHSGSNPVPIPRETSMHHQRSASSSGPSHVRRTSSITSSLQSTPSSPTNQTLYLSRTAFPGSPLISSQSSGSFSSRPRSKESTATSIDSTALHRLSGRSSSIPEPPDQISPLESPEQSKSLPGSEASPVNPRNRSFTVGAEIRPDMPFNWSSVQRISRVFEPDTPSSSSDTESSLGIRALQRVQRRRQRSKRLSSISIADMPGPGRVHRSLDILICEDNPVSRRVLEAMLRKLKCRVVSVVDGAQAITAATGDVLFDVIFTDIKIPRLSGVEVARLIKSSSGTNCQTPIVAMSSYSSSDFKEIAPVFEVRLEKPLTMNTISTTLKSLFTDWCEPQTHKRAVASQDKILMSH